MEAARRGEGQCPEEAESPALLCLCYHFPPIETVYLGIGSNIDPEKNLRAAATLLRKAFKGVRFSPIYKSAPLYVRDQAEFLNAAAVFRTTLQPQAVAKKLRAIEKKLKKNPPKQFGPRTIDLDVLLFGSEILLDDDLTVPHVRLHARRFVLEPLTDLGAGDVIHPGFDRKLRQYLPEVQGQNCTQTTLKKL